MIFNLYNKEDKSIELLKKKDNNYKVYINNDIIIIEKMDFLDFADYIIYDLKLNEVQIVENKINWDINIKEFDKVLNFSFLIYVDKKYYGKNNTQKSINFVFVDEFVKLDNQYKPFSFYVLYNMDINKNIIANDYGHLYKFNNYSILKENKFGLIQNFLFSKYLFKNLCNHYYEIYNINKVNYDNSDKKFDVFIIKKENNFDYLFDLRDFKNSKLDYLLICQYDLSNINTLNIYNKLFQDNKYIINLKNKKNTKDIDLINKNWIINLYDGFDEYFFEVIKLLMTIDYELFYEVLYFLINKEIIKNKIYKNFLNKTNFCNVNNSFNKILIITWNLSGKGLNEDFSKNTLIKINQNKPIFLVFGFQEIFEWKINGFKSLINNPVNNIKIKIKNYLIDLIDKEYELISDESLVALYQILFIKKEYKYILNGLNKNVIKMGYLNLGNKGAINFNLTVNNIQFIFSCCHLEAGFGSSAWKKREENLQSILNCSPNKNYFHFILGDLNFKVNNEYLWVLNNIRNENYKKNLEYDELWNLNKNNIFYEKEINFKPTFKIEDNSYKYVSNIKKIPSYTDRILYKTDEEKFIKYWEYDIFHIIGSDHFPVYSLFEINFSEIFN